MNDDTKQKLAENVSNLPKMLSAWWMSISGTLAIAWLALTPAQQLELISHSPVPAWAYPIASILIGLALRVTPQKSLTTDQPQPDAQP